MVGVKCTYFSVKFTKYNYVYYDLVTKVFPFLDFRRQWNFNSLSWYFQYLLVC